MSRYHPVRPKKKHVKHEAAPEAAPQAPTRLEEVARKFYEAAGGAEVDASIARWKNLLAVHEREVAKLAEGEIEGGYRWTVSPAMAFRMDKYLHALIKERIEMKRAAYDSARLWLASKGEDGSLCPPKPVSDGEAVTSEPETTEAPAEAVPVGV
jgi:hypothetical protein